MGVVAAWERARGWVPSSAVSVVTVLSIGLFAGVVAVAASHHEPWADEAQSWLIGRDTGFGEIWTRTLHYEGTPGLWHTLLRVLALLHLPYAVMGVAAALCGVAAAWLLVFHSPLQLAVRVALPFTFYLCYQYPVVARCYALIPVLLFVIAFSYRKRPVLFTVALSLLALTSLHGLVLSACIWLTVSPWRFARVSAVYGAAVALAIRCAWPARDVTFIAGRNYSWDHLRVVAMRAFAEGFTGIWYVSAAAIALSLPFLWRGRSALFFILAGASLTAVFAVVYSQVWHYGILFLAWIFALWIASYHARPGVLPRAAVLAVAAVQIPWTAASVAYDWANPYSGAREAALYLQGMGIPEQDLYGVGYACTAVQPYFSRNIFGNWNAAYYDWSSRNRSLADLGKLAQLRPEYVLVGHTSMAEVVFWNHDVKKSGYVEVKHFEGNLFWKNDILEPASFDLYRRRDLAAAQLIR